MYAIDIDKKVTDGLRQRLAHAGITNVEVGVGTEDDPHLPVGGLDGVVVLNAYHEMPKGGMHFGLVVARRP